MYDTGTEDVYFFRERSRKGKEREMDRSEGLVAWSQKPSLDRHT